MGYIPPFRTTGSKAAALPVNRLFLFLFLTLPVLLIAGAAFAEPSSGGSGTLDAYATATTNKSSVLVDIFVYFSYLSGALLSALGISELRKHVENPGNTPLRQPLSKLVFGGLFLIIPEVSGIAQDTMGAFSPFAIFKMNAYTFGGNGASGTSGSSLGALIRNGINNTGILVQVGAFVAFVIGVFFIMRGLQMMRAHIENPGNAPLPEALKRLAVGGAMLSFPMIVDVVVKTFGATGSAMGNSGWSGNAASGGGGQGLDAMVVNFVKDIANPALFGIEMFCYIAGILMVLFAMQRLVRSAQDGPRGPLGFGTIVMFIVAGALLSFPQLLTTLDNSLLGGGVARTKVEFMALSQAGVGEDQINNAKNVFSAILAFMAVVGFLSVVRGLFLLKSFADGNQQATMMSVVTHIVAGSICINLGSFINAVQSSLGVSTFAVTFS